MICQSCGTGNLDNADFCQDCGQRLIKSQETEQIICSSCGTKNLGTAIFCQECGSSLIKEAENAKEYCSDCGAELIDGAVFCGKCGHSLQPVSQSEGGEVIIERKAVRCLNCGFMTDAESVFCPECGIKMGERMLETIQQSPQSKKGISKVAWIFAPLTIILLGAVIFLLAKTQVHANNFPPFQSIGFSQQQTDEEKQRYIVADLQLAGALNTQQTSKNLHSLNSPNMDASSNVNAVTDNPTVVNTTNPVLNYYQDYSQDPVIYNAIQKFYSGDIVINIYQFDRVNIENEGWQVVYGGTKIAVNAEDFVMASDIGGLMNEEARVRYTLADAQLGNVIDYYRQYLDQPAVAEAVRRWDEGIRVVNINQFERKIVANAGWKIIYSGTDNTITGLSVILTTDSSPTSTVSTTVLLFDTSDSMGESDASNMMSKLQAAQQAGSAILNIIGNENITLNVQNQVGVIGFSTTPYIAADVTTNTDQLLYSTSSLYNNGSTGMPDGLQLALSQLANTSSLDRRIIIMLSDGLPNVGLNGDQSLDEADVQEQVLELARTAGQNGICIYTVGFGINDPSNANMNEEFLQEVAQASGCGAYYFATDVNQLVNVYVLLRHASTGNVLLNQSGSIIQGQQINFGPVNVPDYQETLLFTLNWYAGNVEPILTDPRGTPIDYNYQNANIVNSSTLTTIIVTNPRAGAWNVNIVGSNIPSGMTQFNAVLSTRQGQVPARSKGITIEAIIAIIVVVVGCTFVIGILVSRKRRHRI